MASVEEVRQALTAVRDPELMLNIVDLGLIYDIEITPQKAIDVSMTLTSPGCPAGPQLINEVYRVLQESFPEFEEVTVHLVWTPFWTPERMSAAAKEALGIF